MLENIKIVGSAVRLLLSVWRAVTGRRRENDPTTISQAPRIGRLLGRRLSVELEIVPVSFEVTLAGPRASIEIWCVAVNYTKKAMAVQHAMVTQFYVGGLLATENLEMVLPVTIEKSRSHQVLFRRLLIAPEVEQIQRHTRGGKASGLLRYQVHVLAGRSPQAFQEPGAMSINGWISGVDVGE